MPENESTTDFEDLQEKLLSLKDQEGLIGYILRSSKSASIDLKDPSKIIDYAILSSAVFGESQKIASVLDLDEIDSIVIESDEIKLLSMTINGFNLSVFMEKVVDHNEIFNSLT
ncbi:MAG: hypothetical protein NWF03_05365 [Candidatus Bathyarchaeota archaeon]|nr:hypothetical protein [Candidatus Bathyarchaeota archaeon]